MKKDCKNCELEKSEVCKIKCENHSHWSEKGKPVGLKFDTGKIRWDLIQWDVMEQVAWIMTFGAEKYTENSWKGVKPFKLRYIGALLRHTFAYINGSKIDPESGFHHLAHAICNCIFLIWGDKNPRKVK